MQCTQSCMHFLRKCVVPSSTASTSTTARLGHPTSKQQYCTIVLMADNVMSVEISLLLFGIVGDVSL